MAVPRATCIDPSAIAVMLLKRCPTLLPASWQRNCKQVQSLDFNLFILLLTPLIFRPAGGWLVKKVLEQNNRPPQQDKRSTLCLELTRQTQSSVANVSARASCWKVALSCNNAEPFNLILKVVRWKYHREPCEKHHSYSAMFIWRWCHTSNRTLWRVDLKT